MDLFVLWWRGAAPLYLNQLMDRQGLLYRLAANPKAAQVPTEYLGSRRLQLRRILEPRNLVQR